MADYDVLIIGSGLAGLTAGLFAARQGLSTLVLEANIPGGHLVSIEKIEDFPGFPEGVPGYELCPNVQRQAADHGVEFQRAEVRRLEPEQSFWFALTDEERLRAKAVIVATGSAVKEIGVPGEEKLLGRGVSHCASCDGPLYNDRVVGVAGGGDSALQEALTLAGYAARVIVFHDRDAFSAQESYRRRVLNNPKIEVRRQTVIEEILGEVGVTGVRVRQVTTNERSTIDLSALFVYVGLAPNTSLVKDILPLSNTGHVLTDAWMRTEKPGLFAAGDIRQDSARQAITSAGDGATAAIAAYRYIKETFR